MKTGGTTTLATLRRALALAAVLLAIVAGSVVFTREMARFGEREEKRRLADMVGVAAASLDPQRVAGLAGGPADAGSAGLAGIRAALARIRAIDPQARFVYLMRRRPDGGFVFLADGEPEGSADYSPPGQPYSDQVDGLRQVMDSGASVIEDPYTDRWGEWVSALAPVLDVRSGRPIAVLGIDIGAGGWLETVARYRAFGIAISVLFGASVGLFLAGLARQRRFNARLAALNSELRTELRVRRRAQQELRLAAEVLANTGEGVVIADAAGLIASVNPAFEHITGFASADAVGRPARMLYQGDADEALYRGIVEAMTRDGRWQGEIASRRKNGQRFPLELSISALRDDDGRVSHYAAIFRDNTAQRQLEDRLAELAALDGLTGIPNRRLFDDALGREWGRAQRERQPLSLVMADLDFFKHYNDRYGHLGGDECLRRVAAAIAREARRPADLAARYGGEEFALILPATDDAGAARIAQQVNRAVRDLALLHEDSQVGEVVTISAGYATVVPVPGSSPDQLIELADRALYRAKHEGRDCVRSADEAAPVAGRTG
ncbi:MAG TPA: diguanylate cyclase [Solimonas sp.]|nr:diguanylate cyclase [Solimonas sp.]